ncbi:MAG: M67 family metallopeptidase [Hydrococcus sp. RM1_1_31]|nr:M67 family metallopeptidase [Hydrococcus sp. RM1_1_31]
MSIIRVNTEQIEQICTHAKNTYPEECCGLLLGRIEDRDKFLTEIRQTENSWDAQITEYLPITPGDKRDRFIIDPKVMLPIQKEARDRNLTIIGIYHSHPDHSAIPSEHDRAIAWQQYSYIIVSVQQGRIADLRSWTLDEAHQFQAEEIVTTS